MPPIPIGPVFPVTPVAAPAGAAPRAGAPVLPPATPAGAGNPSEHFDPSVGVVVLEFHNAAGAVSSSIPSAEQLRAYRRWEQTQVGPQGAASPGGSAGAGAGGGAPVPVRPG